MQQDDPSSLHPLSDGAVREQERRRTTSQATLTVAILSQLGEGVIVADADGTITFVNEAAEQIHGKARLAVGPEDYSHAYRLLTESGQPYPSHDLPLACAVRGETVEDACWRVRRPDGSEVLVRGTARPVRGETGEQIGAVLTMRDVTARAEAERQVRENEARLRTLTDNLPGGMVYQISTGKDGGERRFAYMSQSCFKLLGVTAEAAMKDASLIYALINKDDLPAMVEAERVAIANRTLFDVEVRGRKASGEPRWWRLISAPRETEDGGLLWDGIQVDVTDQKAAEAALKESEEHLATALSTARLGTFDWDLASGDIDLDTRAREIFGLPLDVPVRAQDLFRRIEPAELPAIRALAEASAMRRERLETEYWIRLPDGTRRSVLSVSDAVAGPDGQAERLVGVFADNSEHKRLEEALEERVRERAEELERVYEQLRQSQKLEAMGQLTGGVAHDFNNLLTPIVGGLDMLQRSAFGGEREQRLIGGALESAERAKTLVQRLLAFARRQPLRVGPIDVANLVRGMADLVASTSGPQVKVQVELAPDLPPARSDANQLEMAILNLSVNARDAMPDGGTLTITAAVEQVGADDRAKLAPGSYVRIAVADSGTGMDDETLARAIEPFFSTKGVGKGTGLGLSMVHGLASQLGGAMLIDSKLGLGTKVELLLPVAEAAPGTSARAGGGKQPSASGSVLLVDDEDLVRGSTAEMLREIGYLVTEVASAKEAIALLAQRPFDMVVTDHMMPGMSGTDLARFMAADHPSVPVLVMSGYAGLDGIAPDVARLAKPFRQEELASSLAALREQG